MEREEAAMEKEMKSRNVVLAFLMGSVMGVGAAFVLSKACSMMGSFRAMRARPEGVETGPCSVPEGADICFPDGRSDGLGDKPCSVPEGADICYPG